jgi:hypothetical protein
LNKRKVLAESCEEKTFKSKGTVLKVAPPAASELALPDRKLHRNVEAHGALLHFRWKSRKRLGSADHRQRLTVQRGVPRRSRESAVQHLTAAAETEAQPCNSLLAGSFRPRRICLKRCKYAATSWLYEAMVAAVAPALTAEAAGASRSALGVAVVRGAGNTASVAAKLAAGNDVTHKVAAATIFR